MGSCVSQSSGNTNENTSETIVNSETTKKAPPPNLKLTKQDSLLPQGKNWLSDEDYKFVYSRVPRACVDVIIRKDNKILLTFRHHPPNDSMWHIIGGRIQQFETIEETANRVVNKETDIELDTTKLQLIDYCQFLDEEMPTYKMHSVSYIFEYKLNENQIIEETEKRKWFSFGEFPKNIIKQQGVVINKHYSELL